MADHIVWMNKHEPKPPWLGTHDDHRDIWYRYWKKIWYATPLWAEREPVAAVYREAARLRSNGEDVVVDHIVPLTSDYVCGLHWHHNLTVIHRLENSKKSNLWWPDAPFQQLELEL